MVINTRYLGKAKYIEHISKSSYVGAALLACVGGAADYYMQKRAHQKLLLSYDSALEAGTSPVPCHKACGGVQVNRPSLVGDIHSRLIAAKGEFFGVVCGASGTGKTDVIREACSAHPKGVLYMEVYEPRDLARELAKAAHIPLDEHAHLLDYVVHRAGIQRYSACYRIPRDLQREGVSHVLEIMGARGARFRQKYGFVPCLFVDGADLIANESPAAFAALVDKAKSLARQGSLRIVLVVGGNWKALANLDDSSSSANLPVQVGDITDDEAEDYLKRCGLSAPLSKKIVRLIGGRFAHLQKALWVCKAIPTAEDTALISAVRASLYADMEGALLRARLVGAYPNYRLKVAVLRCVLNSPLVGVTVTEVVKQLHKGSWPWQKWSHESIMEAIGDLVNGSVLRSGDQNVLLVHSRLCETYMRETLKV